MKKCPQCQSIYSDDTLKFCLQDGAILTPAPDANKTLEMSFPSEETIISNRLPEKMVTSFPANIQLPTAAAPPKKFGWLFVLVAVLFLILGGLAAFALFSLREKNQARNTANINVASPPNSAVNREINTPREQIENLQKQPAAQKNQNLNNANAANSTTPDQTLNTPARVDAPNDGFLALRDAPNLVDDSMIAKIPDKTTVKVTACVSRIVVVSGRRGRWCQIIYQGKKGWAFDGWLIF